MMSTLSTDRTELLLGEEAASALREARVIVFGLGGVGGWCAEALVRSGVSCITVVDNDKVDVTNINRQIIATVGTVGLPKAEAMRERLLEINPKAQITAVQGIYAPETAASFDLDSYDYIIDAIDTLRCKAELILNACRSQAVLFSSMGSALKTDPTRSRVSEFWKVEGCPLAASLRRRFKKMECFPKRKFLCVWSPELLSGRTGSSDDPAKAVVNGSMAPVTATFGMILASLVIRHVSGLK